MTQLTLSPVGQSRLIWLVIVLACDLLPGMAGPNQHSHNQHNHNQHNHTVHIEGSNE